MLETLLYPYVQLVHCDCEVAPGPEVVALAMPVADAHETQYRLGSGCVSKKPVAQTQTLLTKT